MFPPLSIRSGPKSERETAHRTRKCLISNVNSWRLTAAAVPAGSKSAEGPSGRIPWGKRNQTVGQLPPCGGLRVLLRDRPRSFLGGWSGPFEINGMFHRNWTHAVRNWTQQTRPREVVAAPQATCSRLFLFRRIAGYFKDATKTVSGRRQSFRIQLFIATLECPKP